MGMRWWRSDTLYRGSHTGRFKLWLSSGCFKRTGLGHSLLISKCTWSQTEKKKHTNKNLNFQPKKTNCFKRRTQIIFEWSIRATSDQVCIRKRKRFENLSPFCSFQSGHEVILRNKINKKSLSILTNHFKKFSVMFVFCAGYLRGLTYWILERENAFKVVWRYDSHISK